jgi:L,D-peptidoglycan transpeptidase YkuD (ErfK/YbiS/YcfS/YnhG family)
MDSIPGIGDSQQVLLVIADDMGSPKAKAYAYEKINGAWQPTLEAMEAVLGSGGLSYNKKEGDKKSPIGVYKLERCFGREENPGTKLSYTQFYQNDFWVDDIHSEYYNTFQKGPSNGRWISAEDLYVVGNRYKYFIVIEYNTVNPLPGAGSAIFLHIWKSPDTPTSGCTALSEENLLGVIRWLDPAKKPVLAQFPAKDFK